MSTEPKVVDPYARCENGCTHDCGRGVLVSELISAEGPYPDSNPLEVGRFNPRGVTIRTRAQAQALAASLAAA